VTQFSAYKAFIDQIVEISRTSVTAKRILEIGHSERTNDDEMPLDDKEQKKRSFQLPLKADDRTILAELLEAERVSALHDFASYLEWQISCGQLVMTWKGENIPSSPYASMHYDFICRCQGDSWPDEQEAK
jgi:hypothetical protein